MNQQEKFKQGDVVRIVRDRRPNKVSSIRYAVGLSLNVSRKWKVAYGANWYVCVDLVSRNEHLIPEDVLEAVPNFILVPAEAKAPEQPVVKPDEMTPFREAFLKEVSIGVGLCAFGYSDGKGERYIERDGPCHAGMSYKHWGAKEIYLDIAGQRKKLSKISDVSVENYDIFVDYILNNSPWSRAFITKDVKDGIERGVSMNPDNPHDITVTAAVALRQGNEFSNMLKPFVEGLKAGMTPGCAFVFGFIMKGGKPASFGGGHGVFATYMDFKKLVNFFEHGYVEKNLRNKTFSSIRIGNYSILESVVPLNRDENDSLWNRICKMDGFKVVDNVWNSESRLTNRDEFIESFKKEWNNAIQ